MGLLALGGLELEGSAFSRPKPLLLLLYLTLEGPQERRHLAELFWPRADQRLQNLAVTLTRLRAAVPAALQAGNAVLRSSVESDVAALEAALVRGDTAAALELYRGPFLHGLQLPLGEELEEWCYATRERLAAALREALVRDAEGVAAAGRFAAAAATAARALDVAGAPPADAELVARLRRLLLAGGHPRSGELDPAATEFNLPAAPSAAAARLALRDAAPTEAFAPLPAPDPRDPDPPPNDATPDAPPHRERPLPLPSTPFVGRHGELAELRRLLQRPEVRLVTLTGMAGVGKTRMALQLAAEAQQHNWFPGGVRFVELDALPGSDEPAAALATLAARIAEVLCVDLRVPDGGPDLLPDATAALAAALGDRPLLLLLDNHEHLTAGAELTAALLRSRPQLKALVTSRQRLGLSAEWLLPLRGLDHGPPDGAPPDGTAATLDVGPSDAVRLFALHARRVQPEFRLAPQLPAVDTICHLLEGLPLAIELAAAWVRALPCQEIVDALREGLDVLHTHAPDAPARHASVRAALQVSWQRLSHRERRLLRRTTPFSGGFNRRAATLVAGASRATLVSLVDASLLRLGADDRYTCHPLLQRFLRDELAGRPAERRTVEHCFLEWLEELVEGAAPHFHDPEQVPWLKRLDEERDNLRAGLALLERRGEVDRLLRWARDLSWYWSYRGAFDEGVRQLQRALQARPRRDALRASALNRLGVLELQRGAWRSARALHEEALAIGRQEGDRRAEASALDNLAHVALLRGENDLAAALLEPCLALRRELGLDGAVAWSLLHLAAARWHDDRPDEGRARLFEALARFRAVGDRHGEAWCLLSAGAWLQRAGDDDGRRLLRESLAAMREIADPVGQVQALVQLGLLARERGDRPGAAARFREAAVLRARFGIPATHPSELRAELPNAPPD